MSELDRRRRDNGSILPLVLTITIVMSIVVLAIATYATTSLGYGQTAEDRSDRLSAADAGMRYAIDQLKLRNAGCILDTQEAVLPGVDADFNNARATVVCERVTSGYEGIQAFAAVMTGVGVGSGTSLLSSQSGSNAKVLGGPVYMSRIDDAAFSLGPPVKIEDGPLLYHDTTGTVPCRSVKPSTIAAVNNDTLVFDPELIFGPVCVTVPWTALFDSPEVPDLTTLVTRDGTLPATSLTDTTGPGSYVDVPGSGGCRVFLPGNYTTPPNQSGRHAYFRTGDYLFDFTGADKTLLLRQGAVTAGRINPAVTSVNELASDMSTQCRNQQSADPSPEFGATFYFGGGTHINVSTQGSLEIHARQQGNDYVSVQTLCDPDPNGNGTPDAIEFQSSGATEPDGYWCNPSGDGGLTGRASTLTAPAGGSMPDFLFTDSGNNREFIAQALVYVPLAQVQFGNVSNSAIQKMLGGLIVSRLVLQSSTSATNFEISVPTSPITAKIQLTSTAVKNGGRSTIQSIVEYRPYEEDIDDRVRVNSWRVCADQTCN
jgi:hypothetical protein